jgi:hypothetical protein
MPTIELWLFKITDERTGKRRRTTYRLTPEDARERYADPEPVAGSLERREVGDGLEADVQRADLARTTEDPVLQVRADGSVTVLTDRAGPDR